VSEESPSPSAETKSASGAASTAPVPAPVPVNKNASFYGMMAAITGLLMIALFFAPFMEVRTKSDKAARMRPSGFNFLTGIKDAKTVESIESLEKAGRFPKKVDWLKSWWLGTESEWIVPALGVYVGLVGVVTVMALINWFLSAVAPAAIAGRFFGVAMTVAGGAAMGILLAVAFKGIAAPKDAGDLFDDFSYSWAPPLLISAAFGFVLFGMGLLYSILGASGGSSGGGKKRPTPKARVGGGTPSFAPPA
jgi:hypothetical protein